MALRQDLLLDNFLQEIETLHLKATDLRKLKKDFGVGIAVQVKEAIGNPKTRKRAKLEARLAEINAQIEDL